MRLTRMVRVQLVVFAVLTVVSMVFASLNYAGVQRLTGIGTYTVTAEFSDAAGLYVNGIVTYRGTDIGTVTAIETSTSGAVATLQLRSSVNVPADTSAHIRSVSAIGEQYIDFQPTGTDGPFLSDGDAISVDRTSVPTSAGTLLKNADELLNSIPLDALRKTIDETYESLNGVGPALGRIIDSSGNLVELAQKNLDPTIKLIEDAGPLLDAGNEIRPDISTFTTSMASFTEQLRLSDAQVRAALDTGPAFADTVGGTLQDTRQATSLILADLQSVGQVLEVNLPNLQHVLVVYPALSAAINFVHQGMQVNGNPHEPQGPLDVKLGSTQSPGPCTVGYESIQRRDPSDTSPMDPSSNLYCRLPQGDPRSVRGARNLPCATDPSVRTAEVAECPRGLPSTWPEMLARPGRPLGTGPTPVPPVPAPVPDSSVAPASFRGSPGRVEAVPYDPATGRFIAPDGVTYTLTDTAPGNEEKEGTQWQTLLLDPVAI